MPGTNEPLYSCVACYMEISEDEFDELQRETTHHRHREGCISSNNNNRGGLSSYLFGWGRHDVSNDYVTLEDYGECVLWESDDYINNSATLLDNIDDGRDNNDIDECPTTTPTTQQLLDSPSDTIDSQMKKEEMERQRIVSFYNRLNNGTTKQAMEGSTNNNIGSSHEIYLNDDGERIVGCLVGTFLSSSRPPSKQQQQQDSTTSERDETAALLIPEPDKHRKMFYIMTLGTVPEFRRFGLGSILVNRVVDMIETQPECGALYLHVITYNKGDDDHSDIFTPANNRLFDEFPDR
eukprot:scaffold26508_cov29-Cyclotella_meneghiniana.AAC.5